MPWPCYLVEGFELAEPRQVYADDPDITTRYAFRLPDGHEVLFGELKVGAMWTDPKRGLCVKLPGDSTGVIWSMRGPSTKVPPTYWNVSGTPPLMTATPSINFVGIYHGFVTNGVVTEDCEKRKFDDFGKLQGAA